MRAWVDIRRIGGDDPGDDSLPPFDVRLAGNRDRGYGWMRREHRLDRSRPHVLTAGDDRGPPTPAEHGEVAVVQ